MKKTNWLSFIVGAGWGITIRLVTGHNVNSWQWWVLFLVGLLSGFVSVSIYE